MIGSSHCQSFSLIFAGILSGAVQALDCRLLLCALTVSTMLLSPVSPVRASIAPLGQAPHYAWKFLSTQEATAVDESIDSIMNQRMTPFSLRILTDAEVPFNGQISLSQDSTSFIFIVGDAYHKVGTSWAFSQEYTNLTTSQSYYIYAPWRDVESVRGKFDFGTANYLYEQLSAAGMSGFHIELGPYLTSGNLASWSSLPSWAKSLDYMSLESAMKDYVTALVLNFKGKVQNYHLWTEANAYYGNGNWPIDHIIEVIKIEAATVRQLDPTARIYVDLDNITPTTLKYFRANSWSTEDFVQRLLTAHVPFDVIGLETHYGSGEVERSGGMDTLYHRLSELAKLGKPLYVWEDGPASFIEPRYLTDQGWWAPQYLWHGIPTEEKQAEYMVADAIVALGNPLVTGLRFLWLYDDPTDLLFWHRFNGVISTNGTSKAAFNAIENLWSSLKTKLALSTDNGTISWKGLAGKYTLNAAGFQPVQLTISQGGTAYTVTLHSTQPTSSTTSTTSTTTRITESPSTQYMMPLMAAVAGIATLIAISAIVRKRRTQHG